MMSKCRVITVLFCVTSVLTSTVTDKNESSIAIAEKFQPAKVIELFEDRNKTSVDNKHDDIVEASRDAQATVSEGGGSIPVLSMPKSSASKPNLLENLNTLSKSLTKTTMDSSVEGANEGLSSASISEVTTKKSKTVRKNGVQLPDAGDIGTIFHEGGNSKPSVGIVPDVTRIKVNNTGENLNASRTNSVNQTSNINMNEGNRTQSSVIVIPSNGNTTGINNWAKIRKPKPMVTSSDTDDDDRKFPSSPTKTPPLGMPRKIDYIAPIVITIMAVPILGMGMFLLYRRGRDCWDKRHYRRMDFLIDGMYND